MVRLISGVVLAAAAVAAILLLPDNALRILAMAVTALAAHEYLQITGARGVVRQTVGIGAAVLLCGWTAAGRPLDGGFVALAGLAWVAAEVLATGRTIHAAAAQALTPLYVGVPLGMLVLVHVFAGPAATLLVVALVIVSDSAQYYAGRSFGRHALAPAISPKKTVEGAIGGLVCGTAFMTVAGAWVLPGSPAWSRALLGAAGVALGICGDLFESRLKRHGGVKDSSSLIPGHGGMLDRIDALLFVAPAFHVYLRYLT